MRKAGLVTFLCAVLASGCLRMENTLTLKEDGSGTFECTCGVPEQTLTQLKAVSRIEADLARAGGDAPPPKGRNYVDLLLFAPEEQVRNELTALKKYGITLTLLKVDNRDARRQVELAVSFQNLAEAAKSDVFKEYGFSLAKNHDGDYVLQRPAPSKEKTEYLDFSKPDNLKLLSPLLGGFYVQVKVNTPSLILRTSAPSKSTRTAIWTFDFDNKPSSFLALQNEGMGIVFEGRGLKLPEVGIPATNSAQVVTADQKPK